ncbi:MAG TPA: glycosyltransferase [Solirubrobacteraceae bacterium]|nr:glycosyltransferase [Solirubrobacteraceae bacterium]
MRIALISPYSWTFPGGVTRHIEALAREFRDGGHDAHVLSPVDPPDLLATVMHRGAHPQRLDVPPDLFSLGRTVGFKANGAVSNLSVSPRSVLKLQRELRTGDYDVVHIHEPIAPFVSWFAAGLTPLPLVGTFHSYSNKWLPNTLGVLAGARRVLNHLHVRIAVSEAAAWTGRRWYGGHYRIIPNGVHVDLARLAGAGEDRGNEDMLRLVFVGQAVERKGLPLLLRAFEALREHIPTELTVIGPTQQELDPLLLDPRGVRALGKVDDRRKHEELARADVLCAPSLGGESFGMVLTEAFAAGTTVVASDIAGYRDVVNDGHDGVLVAPGDAQALAEALRELYHEPDRRRRLSRTAAETVRRFAWGRVAEEVMEAYSDAIAIPRPERSVDRAAVRIGVKPADLRPRQRARRVPSLERPVDGARRRGVLSYVRRIGMLVLLVGGVVLAYLALAKIGIGNIVSALIGSSPTFVVLGLVVMCAAMVMRAFSWDAILTAALPRSRVRLMDALQGTMIGVLMSSTLPARLGEPSRALVVARRTGRPVENFPVVLGTVVSQTILNILALIVLGVIMFSSVNFFNGHENALVFAAVAPAALLAFVLVAPLIVRYGPSGARFNRLRKAMAQVSVALRRVRAGLVVFRDPRLGLIATVCQLAAWALQALSCYLLLIALGLQHRTGFAAAAGVLFAVNVTAVLPATPANLGVFQAACAAVLHQGWHVGFGTGVAYGVILQAVEVATAILMGMPALLKEGMSWREVRLRAMHAAPIKLPPRQPRQDRGGPRSRAGETLGAER